MPNELASCPKCGALPADWVDNPHDAPDSYGREREITALRERIAALVEACQRADRVFRFDLRRLIEFGPEYNQAAKDAANILRSAVSSSLHA